VRARSMPEVRPPAVNTCGRSHEARAALERHLRTLRANASKKS
jgi:hypothetical protein